CVAAAETIAERGIEGYSRLPGQGVDEQSAAHSDAAMDAPHGEVDPLLPQRLVPGEDVLVDTVDERAVEVKQDPERAWRTLHCVQWSVLWKRRRTTGLISSARKTASETIETATTRPGSASATRLMKRGGASDREGSRRSTGRIGRSHF